MCDMDFPSPMSVGSRIDHPHQLGLLVSPDGGLTPFLPSPMTVVDDQFSMEDQVLRLSDNFKRSDVKLGVFYPAGGPKEKAQVIHTHVNTLLSGGKCIVKLYEMRREGPPWLSIANDESVKYYVFVGVPPIRNRGSLFSRQNSSALEDNFFNPRDGKVTRIVFIDPPPSTPQTPQGRRNSLPNSYPEFIHLSLECSPSKLAEMILSHFAAARPVAYDNDNAYWSEVPKLITVNKEKPLLGITLVTREMSPDSSFPRIALIKSLGGDCLQELRKKVGRYTHVQSINGKFLDGLLIKDISEIFQTETQRNTVQLMVRYIHMRKESPQPPPPIGVKLDPTREDLPTPVFILADDHTTAQRLFTSMTELSPKTSTLVQLHSPHLAMSQGSDSDGPCAGICGKQPSSLPIYVNKANKIAFPIDSDKCVIRRDISPSLLNSSPATTPGGACPGYKRTPSLMEQQDIAMKRYTMQMFAKDFDRRLAHIFFRTSGLFLVAASLRDLADDPLIQHENLSLWLRLIQSCMRCAGERRVIIVGMYDEQDDISQIQTYTSHLNHALLENDLNKQLLNLNRNPRQSGTDSNHQYVFMFNTSRESESCFKLFSYMEECMGLFMAKALHFDKPFFESTFEAFDGLNVALREVSKISGVVGTSDTLRSICSRKTHYAIKTVAAYSNALVDPDKKGALLRPHFLPDFLKSLGTMSTEEDRAAIYAIFTISAKHLKALPVVNLPWATNVMESVAKVFSDFHLDYTSKQVILDWAERLGFLFQIGQGTANEVFYFVPMLATEIMGDAAKYNWSPEEVEQYRKPNATVLFAFLNFPASHQFYNCVLAELLIDCSANGKKLYINFGCVEAILTIALEDPNVTLGVMVVYHQLQNVIEFRHSPRSQNNSLRLPFLNAVKTKLQNAYSKSTFIQNRQNIENAFVYHIPSDIYEPKLRESALWKLHELQLAQDEDNSSDSESNLLKTKELTQKVLEVWAGNHPQMKKIPSELFMKWAKKLSTSDEYWSRVGAMLNLFTADDINFWTTKPHSRGNGEVVMKKWEESFLSYKELVNVLRSEDVRLLVLAKEIEDYFSGSDV